MDRGRHGARGAGSRWWAAALLILVGGGATCLAGALRHVVGARVGPGASSGPDVDTLRALFPEDTPALVLAADSSCAACRRALADVPSLGHLTSGGVRVLVRIRGTGAEEDSLFRAIGPGLLPAYLLLDTGSVLVDLHRGYLPPGRLEDWVLGGFLLDPPPLHRHPCRAPGESGAAAGKRTGGGR